MDIIDIQIYKGKNIYSHKPIIKAIIDMGSMYDTPTCEIENFNDRLLKILPGLKKHCCSLGYEGGFAERLTEGTYLTHVTEHMTLELQKLVGYDVHYGKSRELVKPNIYYMAFEYKNEHLAIECLLAAVGIVNELITGHAPNIDEILEYLENTTAETDMGPSTKAIFEEAQKRGIPVKCYDDSCILQLGYGKNMHLIEASLTDRPVCINVDMASNKQLTKRILQSEGIPVPTGSIAFTVRSALAAAQAIGNPVVVKPSDANQGKGVSVNITENSELVTAFHKAIGFSNAAIVEKYIPGNDYRLLIIGGKLAAAAERRPPFILGDGIHTVKQLVEMENTNPLRGSNHEKPLTKIKLDDTAYYVLAKYGYSEESIPAPEAKVLLRSNGNLSTGGTARDCTNEVPPYNVEVATRAVELLGLDIAGVDITCRDISKPLTSENGAIIEINAAPGLRMHLYPSEGTPRNVAGDILEHMYPDSKEYSIPIVSVTGTNGKTTVTRMIAYTLGLSGKNVGMTCTSGIYIGGSCVMKGDNTGALSAERVLSDKSVDAAVLETARGGIIKRGLGYDLADVGVIVNISDDHLGLDGISTIEQLANVKALVVEAIKSDGFAVLNADDEMTPFFISRASCKVMLFSRNCSNSLITAHVANGGAAMYIKEDSICYLSNGKEQIIAEISDIPITLEGRSMCNVENSLAASCALAALGVSSKVIRDGLTGFKPDTAINPGRFNMFQIGSFTVMLDYGHNKAGYRAVIDTISKMEAGAYTAVIGMPGDRSDEDIREVGRICGSFFTKLYIKEDSDLRGRNAGEVADLLYNAAVEAGIDTRNISIIYSEEMALETAIMDAQQGELVIMFFEELESSLEIIEKCRLKLIGTQECIQASDAG